MIASVVPPAIIGGLETIEIQIKHSQATAGLLCMRDRAIQFVLQLVTVGKAGQRVVAGAMLQFALGMAQFGHLAPDPKAYAMIGQPTGRPLNVDAVAILVQVAIAEMALQRARGHQIGLLHGLLAVLRMNQLEYRPSNNVPGGMAQNTLETRIDVKQSPPGIDDAHGVGYQVEQFLEGWQLGDHEFAGWGNRLWCRAGAMTAW